MAAKLVVMCIVFVIALMATGMIASVISGFIGNDTRESYLLQSVAQNIVGFFMAAVATAYYISNHPWNFLGISNKCGWRPFAGVLIVFLIGLPFMNQLIYYNANISLPESMAGLEKAMKAMEEANGKVGATLLDTDSIWGLITGILAVGVLTGFGEEVFFRGTLQRILTGNSRLGVWGVWIAALIFSAVHLQFYGFVPRVLLGAFFGYILYSTGSLWPGVFAHALNNSIVVATTWMQQRGHEMAAADSWGVVESGFPVMAAISMVLLILFFVFGYRYFFRH